VRERGQRAVKWRGLYTNENIADITEGVKWHYTGICPKHVKKIQRVLHGRTADRDIKMEEAYFLVPMLLA
jgi:hypothetical protein